MKKNEIMSKTKIVCTIGPASESKEMLTKLVKAGMNVMRLNFSHGTHEEHEEKINTLLEINKDVFVFNYYFFYSSYLLVRLLHHLHQHCQILNQNYLNELDLILLQNHRHLQM